MSVSPQKCMCTERPEIMLASGPVCHTDSEVELWWMRSVGDLDSRAREQPCHHFMHLPLQFALWVSASSRVGGPLTWWDNLCRHKIDGEVISRNYRYSILDLTSNWVSFKLYNLYSMIFFNQFFLFWPFKSKDIYTWMVCIKADVKRHLLFFFIF